MSYIEYTDYINEEKYRKKYQFNAAVANFDYNGVVHIPAEINRQDDKVSFKSYDENFAKWFVGGLKNTNLDPVRQWYLSGVRDIDNNPDEHVILSLKLQQSEEEVEVRSRLKRINGVEKIEVTASDVFFIMAMTQKQMEEAGPYGSHSTMFFYVRDKEKIIRCIHAFHHQFLTRGWSFGANSIDDKYIKYHNVKYKNELLFIPVPMLA